MTRTEALQQLQTLDSQWSETAAEHDKAIAPAAAKLKAAEAAVNAARAACEELHWARDRDYWRHDRQRQALLTRLETDLRDPRVADAVEQIDATLNRLRSEHIPDKAAPLMERVDRLLAARPRLVSFHTAAAANLDKELQAALADCA